MEGTEDANYMTAHYYNFFYSYLDFMLLAFQVLKQKSDAVFALSFIRK